MIAIKTDKSWSASINQSGVVTAVKSALREAIFGSLEFLGMCPLGIDMFSQFKKKRFFVFFFLTPQLQKPVLGALKRNSCPFKI